MKKNRVWKIIICIVIFIVIGVGLIILVNQDSYQVLIEDDDQCNGREFLFDYRGKEVYVDCIKDTSIAKKGKVYGLKEAIEKEVLSFEQLLEDADGKIEYWDGGSILYQYENFAIINYQKLYDNQCNFIVIGKKDMKIEDYCS